MKRRVKLYGLVALALLAVAGVVNFGKTELSAFVWHVRHGFHTEFGGIRIRVPLFYEASEPAGTAIWITRLPGHLLARGGFINIDFGKLPSPEAMQAAEAMLPRGSASVKRTKVGERTAIFAGRQGTCVEYNAEIVRPPVDGYEIQCRFGADVSVELIGSPDLKNDFYEMIRAAEAVKRKN